MTTINLQVGASADDAYGDTGSAQSIDQAFLRLLATDRFGGIRFQNVTIPNGATINSAALQTYLYTDTADSPDHDVYGQAADTANAFTTTTNEIETLPRTTAKITYTATDLGVGWATGWPDAKAVIQEIVDRAGWASGNALVLIFVGVTDPSLRIRSYDGVTTLAAKLDIDYTAGGTTEFLNAAGSITATGALSIQPQTIYSGVFTPLGAIAWNVLTAYAGQTTPTGEPDLEAQTTFAGSITPNGMLATVKTIALNVSGAITGSGALFFQAGKMLSGSITPTGVLSVVKTIALALSGSITAAGNLIKQINTAYSGQFDQSGQPNYSVSTVYSGLISPIGTSIINKSINLVVQGVLSLTSFITYQINKTSFGIIVPTSNLIKYVLINIGGTITFSSVLSNIKTAIISLSGIIPFSGAIISQINKFTSGIMSLSANIIKQVNTAYSGQGTPSGEPNYSINTSFAGSVPLSGILTNLKSFVLLMGGLITPAGNLIKQINTSYFGQSGLSGQPNYEVQTTLSGSLNLSGILSAIKTSVLSIGGLISFGGVLLFQINKIYQGSLVLSGNIISQVNTRYTGVVSSTGQIIKGVQTLLSGSINMSAVLSLLSIPLIPITESAVYFKGMFKSMFRRMR